MSSPPARILVVDDDADHAQTLADGISGRGMECEVATSGAEAIEKLNRDSFDVVLVDLKLHDVSGIQVLRHARARRPDGEVIVVTGFPSYEAALEALNDGAYDFIGKPVNLPILRAKIRKALERQAFVQRIQELETALEQKTSLEGIVGRSANMQEVFRLVQIIAPVDTTVLILGESGTGKELIARAIHARSQRSGRRFVAINCASLPENLLESELFGHERGAFTGAVSARKGRFQYADGGTLFLDEIGDMPPALQAKILRAIETGEVTPVGTNEPVRVNVRVLAATHRDLEAMVRDGRFREDLYFRINVVRVELPPLRERLEDLPLLVAAFLKEASRIHGKEVRGVTPAALDLLYRYRWPGNVRELKNIVESMVVLAQHEVLDVADVPRTIRGSLEERRPSGDEPPPTSLNLKEAEGQIIQRALLATKGNRREAARLLGIGERTLYRKVQEHGLE